MKDMDLFGSNELSKKINFKEFLNSNHRALSLQRSGNVLEYFLRYGNGYKSILIYHT